MTAMKAFIFVKFLCLHHVLVRLPCLAPTFPLHKEFHAAVIQFSIVTNHPFLLASVVNHRGCLRVITPLWIPARGVGLRLGVIPYLNGPRRTSREIARR